MRLSQRQVNKNLEKEIFQMLYQLIVDIKTPEEAKSFLEDVFGKNESLALAKRLAVSYYLSRGRSYGNIRENLKVSSATISTVDKARDTKGFALALKKMGKVKF